MTAPTQEITEQDLDQVTNKLIQLINLDEPEKVISYIDYAQHLLGIQDLEPSSPEECLAVVRGTLEFIQKWAQSIGDPQESLKEFPLATLITLYVEGAGLVRSTKLTKEFRIKKERLEWMAQRGLLLRYVDGKVVLYKTSVTGYRAVIQPILAFAHIEKAADVIRLCHDKKMSHRELLYAAHVNSKKLKWMTSTRLLVRTKTPRLVTYRATTIALQLTGLLPMQ